MSSENIKDSVSLMADQRLEDSLRKIYNEEFTKVDDLIDNIILANNVAIENSFGRIENLLNKVFPIVGENYTHKITILKKESPINNQ